MKRLRIRKDAVYEGMLEFVQAPIVGMILWFFAAVISFPALIDLIRDK
jgi:hypothetical protein